jgi:hypothetical protein
MSTNPKKLAADPELVEVCESIVAWNKKYPTSRIFSEGEIRKIAKEMDEICKMAELAIANAKNRK